MKREWDMSEVSDGCLYGENDLVKADCNGCHGCSACCKGMGNSIVLDPYDLYRLQVGTGKELSAFLTVNEMELQVVDGLILPNLAMNIESEKCNFLDEAGRCSIHPFRPGICRLFPLGRIYEDGDYKYFLQVHECPSPNKSKVKPSKWIDTPENGKYHNFLLQWHDLRMEVQEMVLGKELEVQKKITMLFLQVFFLQGYITNRDFYEQFAERMGQWAAFGKM